MDDKILLSLHYNLHTGKSVFGRDIIFNLASVIYWRVITAAKHRQVDIVNVQENAKRVTHDYAVGN